jgi:hypothetical protein
VHLSSFRSLAEWAAGDLALALAASGSLVIVLLLFSTSLRIPDSNSAAAALVLPETEGSSVGNVVLSGVSVIVIVAFC